MRDPEFAERDVIRLDGIFVPAEKTPAGRGTDHPTAGEIAEDSQLAGGNGAGVKQMICPQLDSAIDRSVVEQVAARHREIGGRGKGEMAIDPQISRANRIAAHQNRTSHDGIVVGPGDGGIGAAPGAGQSHQPGVQVLLGEHGAGG